MAQFTVTLPRYGQTWEFNRDQFITAFPDSIISNLLEYTSDTDIEITQPFVTPMIMDLLSAFIVNRVIPFIDPDTRPNLIRSGNYLNISVLLVLGDPNWPGLLEEHPTINLANASIEDLYHLLEFGIGKDDLLLIDYAINLGADPSVNNNEYIATASYEGALPVVNRLLEDERVDPSANNNRALFNAVGSNNAPVLERLLKDSRVDPTVNHNELLRHAVYFGYGGILDLLLKDSRVDPLYHKEDQTPLLEMAFYHNQAVSARRLLSDPRIDPTVNNNTPIREAAISGNLEIVNLLLSDPRVNPFQPNHLGHTALDRAAANGRQEVIEAILGSRADTVTIPDVELARNAAYVYRYSTVNRFLENWLAQQWLDTH